MLTVTHNFVIMVRHQFLLLLKNASLFHGYDYFSKGSEGQLGVLYMYVKHTTPTGKVNWSPPPLSELKHSVYHRPWKEMIAVHGGGGGGGYWNSPYQGDFSFNSWKLYGTLCQVHCGKKTTSPLLCDFSIYLIVFFVFFSLMMLFHLRMDYLLG